MVKRIIVIGLAIVMCLVVCLGVFVGCEDDEMDKTRVWVVINSKGKNKFLAEEFTSEDFEWDNIEKIGYGEWYTTALPEKGEMVVYLKKQGKKRVNDAIEHFETLYFVKEANKVIVR